MAALRRRVFVQDLSGVWPELEPLLTERLARAPSDLCGACTNPESEVQDARGKRAGRTALFSAEAVVQALLASGGLPRVEFSMSPTAQALPKLDISANWHRKPCLTLIVSRDDEDAKPAPERAGEWLQMVLVSGHDPATSALGKPTTPTRPPPPKRGASKVFERMRVDFSQLRAGASPEQQAIAERTVRVEAWASADELGKGVLQQQLDEAARRLTHAVMGALLSRAALYESECARLLSRSSTVGWNLCTYLVVREGHAMVLAQARQFPEALALQQGLVALLCDVEEAHAPELPIGFVPGELEPEEFALAELPTSVESLLPTPSMRSAIHESKCSTLTTLRYLHALQLELLREARADVALLHVAERFAARVAAQLHAPNPGSVRWDRAKLLLWTLGAAECLLVAGPPARPLLPPRLHGLPPAAQLAEALSASDRPSTERHGAEPPGPATSERLRAEAKLLGHLRSHLLQMAIACGFESESRDEAAWLGRSADEHAALGTGLFRLSPLQEPAESREATRAECAGTHGAARAEVDSGESADSELTSVAAAVARIHSRSKPPQPQPQAQPRAPPPLQSAAAPDSADGEPRASSALLLLRAPLQLLCGLVDACANGSSSSGAAAGESAEAPELASGRTLQPGPPSAALLASARDGFDRVHTALALAQVARLRELGHARSALCALAEACELLVRRRGLCSLELLRATERLTAEAAQCGCEGDGWHLLSLRCWQLRLQLEDALGMPASALRSCWQVLRCATMLCSQLGHAPELPSSPRAAAPASDEAAARLLLAGAGRTAPELKEARPGGTPAESVRDLVRSLTARLQRSLTQSQLEASASASTSAAVSSPSEPRRRLSSSSPRPPAPAASAKGSVPGSPSRAGSTVAGPTVAGPTVAGPTVASVPAQPLVRISSARFLPPTADAPRPRLQLVLRSAVGGDPLVLRRVAVATRLCSATPALPAGVLSRGQSLEQGGGGCTSPPVLGAGNALRAGEQLLHLAAAPALRLLGRRESYSSALEDLDAAESGSEAEAGAGAEGSADEDEWESVPLGSAPESAQLPASGTPTLPRPRALALQQHSHALVTWESCAPLSLRSPGATLVTLTPSPESAHVSAGSHRVESARFELDGQLVLEDQLGLARHARCESAGSVHTETDRDTETHTHTHTHTYERCAFEVSPYRDGPRLLAEADELFQGDGHLLTLTIDAGAAAVAGGFPCSAGPASLVLQSSPRGALGFSRRDLDAGSAYVLGSRGERRDAGPIRTSAQGERLEVELSLQLGPLEQLRLRIPLSVPCVPRARSPLAGAGVVVEACLRAGEHSLQASVRGLVCSAPFGATVARMLRTADVAYVEFALTNLTARSVRLGGVSLRLGGRADCLWECAPMLHTRALRERELRAGEELALPFKLTRAAREQALPGASVDVSGQASLQPRLALEFAWADAETCAESAQPRGTGLAWYFSPDLSNLCLGAFIALEVQVAQPGAQLKLALGTPLALRVAVRVCGELDEHSNVYLALDAHSSRWLVSGLTSRQLRLTPSSEPDYLEWRLIPIAAGEVALPSFSLRSTRADSESGGEPSASTELSGSAPPLCVRVHYADELCP